MSNLAAPWILLSLYGREAIHGYEISKMIRTKVDELGIGLNIAGLYRHLSSLEKRGMLVSEWDTGTKGPARRRYSLTEAGKECLWQWTQTLSLQVMLIGKFLDHTREIFPGSRLPTIDCDDLCAPSRPAGRTHQGVASKSG